MCGDCFPENTYRFSSEQDYTRVETVVWHKIRQGVLSELKAEPIPTNYPHDLACQCQTCREIRLLSMPDNAWRGYLLTQDVAAAYTKKLRRHDRMKAIVGIGCLLAVGAAIWWSTLR